MKNSKETADQIDGLYQQYDLLLNTYNALDKAHQTASDQIQRLNDQLNIAVAEILELREFKELATVTNIGYQKTIAEVNAFMQKVVNLNRVAKEHIDDEFFNEAKRLLDATKK